METKNQLTHLLEIAHSKMIFNSNTQKLRLETNTP